MNSWSDISFFDAQLYKNTRTNPNVNFKFRMNLRDQLRKIHKTNIRPTFHKCSLDAHCKCPSFGMIGSIIISLTIFSTEFFTRQTEKLKSKKWISNYILKFLCRKVERPTASVSKRSHQLKTKLELFLETHKIWKPTVIQLVDRKLI